jgi:putative protease
MEIFINSSPHLEGELRRTFTDKHLFKKIPLSLTVSGALGEPLTVTATDIDGHLAVASSTQSLQKAKSAPLSAESIRDELGALSGTIFSLDKMETHLADCCFLHNRELKELRRSLCAQLEEARLHRAPIQVRTFDESCEWIAAQAERNSAAPLRPAPSLTLLVREIEQLTDLQGLPISTVYLDFEFGKEYHEAARMLRDMGHRVGIATTRILKPGELAHLKVIERIRPDEVLVRNLGALHYLRSSGLTLIGDFSLNITNSLSAQWFIEKGLARFTPSYDLNSEQLCDLIATVPAVRCEVTLHHYIPAFHMEHCVFAAFLSNGSSYRDCGRPCEKHRVELRDPKGALHPLKADAECRNTMFNGHPQSATKLIPDLLNNGVCTFRVEALFENSTLVRQKVLAYSDLLSGARSVHETIEAVGATEKVGVTDGQLYNIRSYTDRKKKFVSLSDLSTAGDPGFRAILPNSES